MATKASVVRQVCSSEQTCRFAQPSIEVSVKPLETTRFGRSAMRASSSLEQAGRAGVGPLSTKDFDEMRSLQEKY